MNNEMITAAHNLYLAAMEYKRLSKENYQTEDDFVFLGEDDSEDTIFITRTSDTRKVKIALQITETTELGAYYEANY